MMPAQKENLILRETEPELRIKSGEDILLWQKNARKKLSVLLGLENFKEASLKLDIEYEKEYADFFETRFTFQSEEGLFVPCHFLRPKKADKKAPVIICLQGHSTGMHISLGVAKFEGDEKTIAGDRDFCLQAVENGFCCVAMEQRGFGELGGTPETQCADIAFSALLTGRTILGARVWDIKRLIDVLETEFSSVCDTDRIYCMGNSGGGTATFYAAALEERIKGAMPSCSFCTFVDSIGEIRHCSCNFVPGIARFFDMAEIAGMISPRPLVIVSGEKDSIFPITPAKEEFARLKNLYYKEKQISGKCYHFIGGEGHRFYKGAWEIFNNLTDEKSL
ncbi:MAG: acetylxylan esterase [Clostridia bacterium]|nr:acetylxylan esterase [Clostridia bacterium]